MLNIKSITVGLTSTINILSISWSTALTLKAGLVGVTVQQLTALTANKHVKHKEHYSGADFHYQYPINLMEYSTDPEGWVGRDDSATINSPHY